MNVLAMETSGKIITVAVSAGTTLIETALDAGFRHAETLMPAVASVLELAGIEPSELDLVACSKGPGSFTALRIGMATAKGIARGAGCDMKAVPTLPLLAAGREHWPGIVVPLMDARKKRVYAAAFQAGKRIAEDSDVPLDDFLASLPGSDPVLATGPDAEVAAGRDRIVIDPLKDSARGRILISAAILALEKEGPDPADVGPLYLRLSEAEEALAGKDGS
jgi:tRNA threonylcarbamoyladenosine biosynthesis protein TsaB